MRNNNHNKDNQYENCDTDMDRGAYNDMLNSDNAFSDKGLENAALTEESLNREANHEEKWLAANIVNVLARSWYINGCNWKRRISFWTGI